MLSQITLNSFAIYKVILVNNKIVRNLLSQLKKIMTNFTKSQLIKTFQEFII